MLVIVGGLLLSLICRLLWAFPIGYQVGSIVTAFVLALSSRSAGKYPRERFLIGSAGFSAALVSNTTNIKNIDQPEHTTIEQNLNPNIDDNSFCGPFADR